jgi:hypothetical protein
MALVAFVALVAVFELLALAAVPALAAKATCALLISDANSFMSVRLSVTGFRFARAAGPPLLVAA